MKLTKLDLLFTALCIGTVGALAWRVKTAADVSAAQQEVERLEDEREAQIERIAPLRCSMLFGRLCHPPVDCDRMLQECLK